MVKKSLSLSKLVDKTWDEKAQSMWPTYEHQESSKYSLGWNWISWEEASQGIDLKASFQIKVIKVLQELSKIAERTVLEFNRDTKDYLMS